MSVNTVILVGTSNAQGNTRRFADELANKQGADVIDISDFDIFFYDYEHRNRHDDFIRIIEDILDYELIIFASPVYWYAMSAQMKVFFDRLSDLLTVRKDLGRRFKDKHYAVLSTGAQPLAPECFIEPFKLTMDYFDMQFRGHFYAHYSTLETESNNHFLMLRQVEQAANSLFVQQPLTASSIS